MIDVKTHYAMPRLALSLPTELGSVRGDASGRPGSLQSLLERGPIDASQSDDGTDRTPQIESWLACWSDGQRADDVT